MSEVKKYRADHRHVVETEFDDAQYVGIADFDAQSLRADTAEAERDALRLVFENAEDCELNDAEQKLAAAERRIERMSEVLQILRVCASISPELKRAIDAALNPNREAESHVDCGSCRNITDGCKGKCQRSEEWSKP